MGYVDEVLEVVKKKNADQPENHRAGSSDHVPCSLGR